MNTEQTNSLEKKHLLAPMHLIIVLALTGVLVALAMIPIQNAREQKHKFLCQESLVRIDMAKQQWALENGIEFDASPTMKDLVIAGFLEKPPRCPGGGTYSIGKLSEDPSCSLSNKQSYPHHPPICGAPP